MTDQPKPLTEMQLDSLRTCLALPYSEFTISRNEIASALTTIDSLNARIAALQRVVDAAQLLEFRRTHFGELRYESFALPILANALDALSTPSGRAAETSGVSTPTAPREGTDSGWQPIETAPRDGTRFLAFERDASPQRYECWWENDFPIWEGWQTDWDDEPEPTHWRSLPEPPSITTQAGDLDEPEGFGNG